jgi:hypothetical protein
MSHGEDYVLEHPALAPANLDLAPRNKQRRMHEPKNKHAGQKQALLTDSNRQDVAVVRQPPHLSTPHSRFRSIERYVSAIDLRQREPAAYDADGRADQKPQKQKINREDRRKRGGMLVNQPLEIHASQLALNGLSDAKQPFSAALLFSPISLAGTQRSSCGLRLT